MFGALLAAAIVTLFSKERLAAVADGVAFALATGYAVGRVGCFLVGDDYGKPTDLPWGIAFPKGSPPTDVPVHPTQLYEILASLFIFALLVWVISPLVKREGVMFFVYLILAGRGAVPGGVRAHQSAGGPGPHPAAVDQHRAVRDRRSGRVVVRARAAGPYRRPAASGGERRRGAAVEEAQAR